MRLGIAAVSASCSRSATNATLAMLPEGLNSVSCTPKTNANCPATESARASCETNAPSRSTLNNPQAATISARPTKSEAPPESGLNNMNTKNSRKNPANHPAVPSNRAMYQGRSFSPAT